MSRALYRKYRSKSLDEIVGQKHVTDILSRALAQGNIAHAYLLTGPRGIGKTSIARILAHEINGLEYADDMNHLDIIEIDAASNNGVEDVRDLREKVQVAPVSAKRKVYIIDEVHMLSKAAFNALLKTLEEPPAHIVFILATTDVDKLPPTIISRTQRFGLRAIAHADALQHLRHIAKQEKIVIDDEALALLARHGDGSFRDSISLLDQLSSLADKKAGITKELVEQSLGLAPQDIVESLLTAVDSHDQPAIVQILDQAEAEGLQGSVIATQLIQAVRGQLVDNPSAGLLLDQLLDIGRSTHPSLKLLTTLLKAAAPKTPKAAALAAASTPVISAPIKELEKKATQKKPKDMAVSITQQKNGVATKSSETSAAQAEQGAEALREAQREVVSEDFSSDDANADNSKQHQATAALDWPTLLDYTRKHHVAIHSVLSKCTPDQDGTTLNLYTVNKFYKKKLDDSKYLAHLHASLQHIGVDGLDIHTIPTPPPPKDSQAAAVAAIMGGGEEIALD